MSKSVVSIVKDPNPERGVRETLRLLGGVESFLKKGQKVLIKPNLSFPIPPDESPDVTHPDVIAALVKVFKDGGAQRVVVGDQSVWGVRTRDSFRITRVQEAVEREGGEICCFDEEPRIMVDVPDGKIFDRISLPKIVKGVDLIVNVPKMKTSFIAHVTLGIKNHYGFVPFEDRLKFHRMMDLAYALVDIVKVVKPNLTLIDGIIAMEGYGPHAGSPKRMDVIVAGRDVVAVDAIGATIMGYDPFEPPTTQVGWKYGLGNAELSKIDIVGESIHNVKCHFARPVLMYISAHPNVEVYVGGMCPGCAPRIPAIPPNPDPNKRYAVIIGRRAKIPRKIEVDEVWCFGKCGIDSGMALRRFFSHMGRENIHIVPGCPPLRWYAKQTMLKKLMERGWARDFTAR